MFIFFTFIVLLISAATLFNRKSCNLSEDELVGLYAKMVNPLLLNPAQEEFMSWHHRLNHLPFAMMKRFPKQDLLQKQLSKVSSCKCASCIFGKAHRQPWQTSDHKNSIRKEDHD